MSWAPWWEDNKDLFLDAINRSSSNRSTAGSSGQLTGRGRRTAVAPTRRPDPHQVTADIVDPLLGLLDSSSDRDVLGSALLTLGRVAQGEDATRVADAALAFLHHGETGVQTAAALSLGMLGDASRRELLEDLLYCSPEGHKAVKAGAVPTQVRAAAALSLGLLGQPESVQAIIDYLDRQPDGPTDIVVCAITALGLTRHSSQQETACRWLMDRLDDGDLGGLVRSYIPTALGKLGNAMAVDALVTTLRDRKADNRVTQSAALGLGALAAIDQQRAVEALLDGASEGRDIATRNFCFIGLARVGARDADPAAHGATHAAIAKLLSREIGKPSRENNRSWASLAGAIYGRAQPASAHAIVESLLAAYQDERDPAFKGAGAVALGLIEARAAAPLVLQDFLAYGDEDFRGYAAVALGLLGYKDAAEELRAVCEDKASSAPLRLQTARALGLLGDTDAVRSMLERLDAGGTTTLVMSLMQSLGVSGDRQAIPLLKQFALDERLPENTRAAACLALGLVGERTSVPWHAAIKADNNYLAQVPSIEFVLGLL